MPMPKERSRFERFSLRIGKVMNYSGEVEEVSKRWASPVICSTMYLAWNNQARRSTPGILRKFMFD